MLHIAVNTNVSEGFVVTAIWSTYMEGRPADRFVLDIAVNTTLRSKSDANFTFLQGDLDEILNESIQSPVLI